jgi:tRNA threonylcarbamoyladenosine biosynthesis protein TsaB
MILLALETATEACSVALWIEGDVRERFEIAPRRHTELVLPWIDGLLADAGIRKSQIDAIACGRGPGAFTGVRLAVALTQGLALALDRPVIGISTLAALALDANAADGDRIIAAIDARMSEVYVGTFTRAGDTVRALDAERILPPRQVTLDPIGSWIGVGTGFAAEQGALATTLGDRLRAFDAEALPHAAAIARLGAVGLALGEGIAPERLEPAYLRDKVALTLVEQGKA